MNKHLRDFKRGLIVGVLSAVPASIVADLIQQLLDLNSIGNIIIFVVVYFTFVYKFKPMIFEMFEWDKEKQKKPKV